MTLLPLRGSRALEKRHEIEEKIRNRRKGDERFDLFIIATKFHLKMLGNGASG